AVVFAKRNVAGNVPIGPWCDPTRRAHRLEHCPDWAANALAYREEGEIDYTQPDALGDSGAADTAAADDDDDSAAVDWDAFDAKFHAKKIWLNRCGLLGDHAAADDESDDDE